MSICVIIDNTTESSSSAPSDINEGNEEVHTNQVCQPNDVKMEVRFFFLSVHLMENFDYVFYLLLKFLFITACKNM